MTSGAGASVKRHTCPDETATVVNGRWICNCPGGPYPAPPAKSPLPAQAGGAPVTPSALESALAKLRECADMTMFVEVNHDEAAALLERLEAADKWRALMSCERIRVLGSCLIEGEDYGHIGLEVWTRYANFPESADRQDREILERFIERAYRNPQPSGGGE